MEFMQSDPAMVAFLATEKAKHTTGLCHYVDGGRTMF